jgi:hypothetical protein
LLGYDEKEIRALLSARTTITSLDMPLGGGKEGDSTLIDVLA